MKDLKTSERDTGWIGEKVRKRATRASEKAVTGREDRKLRREISSSMDGQKVMA